MCFAGPARRFHCFLQFSLSQCFHRVCKVLQCLRSVLTVVSVFTVFHLVQRFHSFSMFRRLDVFMVFVVFCSACAAFYNSNFCSLIVFTVFDVFCGTWGLKSPRHPKLADPYLQLFVAPVQGFHRFRSFCRNSQKFPGSLKFFRKRWPRSSLLHMIYIMFFSDENHAFPNLGAVPTPDGCCEVTMDAATCSCNTLIILNVFLLSSSSNLHASMSCSLLGSRE